MDEGWSFIKIQGPLDFGLTGILSSISRPLADAKISLFAISTYDTDYLLVKESQYLESQKTLTNHGFVFL